jgi:hypothetical protein
MQHFIFLYIPKAIRRSSLSLGDVVARDGILSRKQRRAVKLVMYREG